LTPSLFLFISSVSNSIKLRVNAATACRQVEKKFIEEHLTRWIPSFCEQVLQEAELPFYHAMAALTRSFIEFETEEMNKNSDGVK